MSPAQVVEARAKVWALLRREADALVSGASALLPTGSEVPVAAQLHDLWELMEAAGADVLAQWERHWRCAAADFAGIAKLA